MCRCVAIAIKRFINECKIEEKKYYCRVRVYKKATYFKNYSEILNVNILNKFASFMYLLLSQKDYI